MRRCQLDHVVGQGPGDDSFESTLNISQAGPSQGANGFAGPGVAPPATRPSAGAARPSSSSAFAVSYSRDFGTGLDFSDRDGVQKRAVGGNFRDRNCIARLGTAKFRDDASEGRTDGALRTSSARVGEGGSRAPTS